MTGNLWPAPAKLNLCLYINGRRADGYHRLQTLFQFLDHCDFLEFKLRKDGCVVRVCPPAGLSATDDLTVRAATLLQRFTGSALGVEIRLHKNLPIGGGLGGGSSDAATVLHALNQLWKLGLGNEQLARLGLRLGADVPVFVHGQAAWAEGVGERLTPVHLPGCWYVVVVPTCQVSTAAVFSAPDLTRNTPVKRMCAFLGDDCGNDCESVVYNLYPEVAAAAQHLGAYGCAHLTGTGGCVFSQFATRSLAEAALAQMLCRGFQGFVARGLNRSPLQETGPGSGR